MKYLDNIEGTFVSAIGYTGFILLTGHAIPHVFKTVSYMRDMSHIDEKNLLLSSLSLNIVSGVLIVVYGILIKSDPILYGVLSFLVVNLMCFIGMIGVACKRNNVLY